MVGPEGNGTGMKGVAYDIVINEGNWLKWIDQWKHKCEWPMFYINKVNRHNRGLSQDALMQIGILPIVLKGKMELQKWNDIMQ